MTRGSEKADRSPGRFHQAMADLKLAHPPTTLEQADPLDAVLGVAPGRSHPRQIVTVAALPSRGARRPWNRADELGA